MKNGFIQVLIVDDEPLIRQGLKNTLDWSRHGFFLCGEAGTGEEAIRKISDTNPDLVLLDVRMPRMSGTELMECVRKNGYEGYFIVLSGYSDFRYAQDALRFGASFYLTKPVDEEELLRAVLSVKEDILKKHTRDNSLQHYKSQAKKSLLHELLEQGNIDNSINYAELGFSSWLYQVVVYESYTPYYNAYSLADMLLVATDSFEEITVAGRNVILLKGESAIERFRRCLQHYRSGTEKGSPLDILFITYGPEISDLSLLHKSFETCCMLLNRRFFCAENQHVLSYDDLPEPSADHMTLDLAQAEYYGGRYVDYIQSYNRRQIAALNEELTAALYHCGESAETIKYFLIDIFLQVKSKITWHYSSLEIPFAYNAAIIETLNQKYYLYEIMDYFDEQFEMIMRALGGSSSQSILDDILYYIDHNFQENLKIKTLTSLFGYNSSYLGKLFKEHVGQSFNSYLDSVRIEKAATLLSTTSLRVYEISAQVGYRNVDYFQQKFKKLKGVTPSDYRSG